jgi:hypothetical protein
VRVNGKLIRRSLETHVLSVAKLKLSDFLQDHRRLAINKGEPVKGEVIIEMFKKEFEDDHTNKPGTKLYKQETLIALKKSWPELFSTDRWVPLNNDHIIELRLGKALEILPQLAADKRGPFDLVFIDADKPGTRDYFAWALKLSHMGSLIIADNVVRKGALIDANSADPNVRGMQRFHQLLSGERRVSATTLQTVGCKGYDGFTLALVTSENSE